MLTCAAGVETPRPLKFDSTQVPVVDALIWCRGVSPVKADVIEVTELAVVQVTPSGLVSKNTVAVPVGVFPAALSPVVECLKRKNLPLRVASGMFVPTPVAACRHCQLDVAVTR